MPFAVEAWALAAALAAFGSAAVSPTACRDCHSGDAPTFAEPALKPCPRAGKPGSAALAGSPDVLRFEAGEGRYGPVRFAHRAHAEMAATGGGCALCHHHGSTRKVEACAACHAKDRLRADVSTPDLQSARHRLCIDCHRRWGGAAADCDSCHSGTKGSAAPQLGWLNNRFHSGLACSACHKSPGQFDGKNTGCALCHAGWPKGFKHETTGQGLDAAHAALDCVVCHSGKGYSDSPACSNCHDDRNFPAQRPGPRVPAQARR